MNLTNKVKYMKTTIFYFSGTGNSLYAAKKLSSLLPDCELMNIVTCMHEDKFSCESDNIGIICPIYAFGLPTIVDDFLKKLTFSSNPYIFAMLTTGGGSADLGFSMIHRTLKSKGLELSHSSTLKYVSNYHLTGGVYSPNDAKALIISKDKDIINFSKAVSTRRLTIETFKMRYSIYLFYLLWKNVYKNKDKKFKVNSKCIQCDVCAKVCPNNNISLDLGTPVWNGNCLDCTSCINNCPMHAIDIGKKSIDVPLYRNPFIELKELFYK